MKNENPTPEQINASLGEPIIMCTRPMGRKDCQCSVCKPKPVVTLEDAFFDLTKLQRAVDGLHRTMIWCYAQHDPQTPIDIFAEKVLSFDRATLHKLIELGASL